MTSVSGIAFGTRVPYHSTSRARLSDVTADALRCAAVRLPPDDLMQTGHWFARGHLRFTPEARAVLPVIMGGACHVVPYAVSRGSRAVVLRAAETGTRRRALARSMDLDSMGFTADESAGLHSAGPLAALRTADPSGDFVGSVVIDSSPARLGPGTANPSGGFVGTASDGGRLAR